MAGCAKPSDGPSPTPRPQFGAIEGQVIDDELKPLPGVRIQVLLSELNASTDDAGRFHLPDVPVGPQRLVASLEGFSSQTRTAAVEPGSTARFDFQLESVQRVLPFNRTVQFTGLLLCSLPQDVTCNYEEGGNNVTFRFPVDPGLRGLVVEIRWTPTAPGTNQRLGVEILAATSAACGREYQEAEGSSVLRMRVLSGYPESGGHQCINVRGTGEDPTVRQEFDAYVTVFYHEPPPDGFSAVP